MQNDSGNCWQSNTFRTCPEVRWPPEPSWTFDPCAEEFSKDRKIILWCESVEVAIYVTAQGLRDVWRHVAITVVSRSSNAPCAVIYVYHTFMPDSRWSAIKYTNCTEARKGKE